MSQNIIVRAVYRKFFVEGNFAKIELEVALFATMHQLGVCSSKLCSFETWSLS